MEAVSEALRTDPKRCGGVRKDGGACEASVLTGNYCFAHDPARAVERAEARRKGGRQSAKIVRLRGLLPPRLLPVYDRLEQALGEVHEGSLDARQAQAMAGLARAMVSVLQAGELEARVRELEEHRPA